MGTVSSTSFGDHRMLGTAIFDICGVSPGFILMTVAILLAAICNIIGGQCIPFWILPQFLFLFMFAVTDLINISISNSSQINDLAELDVTLNPAGKSAS